MTRQAWKQLFTTISACLLTASVAFGQQEDRERQQRQNADQPATSAQQVELPQFLNEIDLTSEQERNIKQALQQNNQKLMKTWREFHTKYARAVELEAAWAVAVRDTLSEQDQRKFDQQQMQDREMQRQEGATQRRSSPPPRDEAARDRTSDSEANTRRQRREQRQRDDAQRTRSDAQTRTDDQQQPAEGFSFVVFTITSPESYTQGTNQTDEQKQQCSEACREFKRELTSAWQGVRRLHSELVTIEADRIEVIEEELTEDQLAQLKEQRQSPSEETASDVNSQRRSR